VGLIKLINIQGWAGIIAATILATLLGLQIGKTHHEHTSAGAWEQKFNGEHSAFLQTIINYSHAVEQAREDDAANKARVEREAAAVSHERQTSYEARIADADARARRLQQQADAAAAHQGGSGAAPVPGVPGAAGGADGSPGEDGLSRDDRLIATKQAIRLDELQKWISGVLGIDLSGSKGTPGAK
jgi:hypothetical protein